MIILNFKKFYSFLIVAIFFLILKNDYIYAFNFILSDRKSTISILSLENVILKMNKIGIEKGLQANFDQNDIFNNIELDNKLKGKIIISKPYYMKWEYQFPHTRVILCKKDIVWFFNPLEKYAIMGDVKNFIDEGMYIPFMSDITKLRNIFFVSLEKKCVYNDLFLFVLVPKSKSNNFIKIKVYVSKDNFYISKIEAENFYGGGIVIKFKDFILNYIFDRKLFEIDILQTTNVWELSN